MNLAPMSSDRGEGFEPRTLRQAQDMLLELHEKIFHFGIFMDWIGGAFHNACPEPVEGNVGADVPVGPNKGGHGGPPLQAPAIQCRGNS